MNLKLCGKTGFYSCKTPKQVIYDFRIDMHALAKHITCPTCLQIFPLSSLSLSHSSSLFVSMIYLYICLYLNMYALMHATMYQC